jgi:hypothetical protein
MLETQISQAYDISTELDLITTRKRARGRALSILIREIKEIQNEISTTNSEIRQLSINLNELDNKRTKLNHMNFASSDHLKKTHKRYWEQVQDYTRKISKNFDVLSNLENLQYQKKLKLSHLRSEINNLIKQEEFLLNRYMLDQGQLTEYMATS